MALNILAIQVREAVRYEPASPTKTKEAVDGTRLDTLADPARPFQADFLRRFFEASVEGLGSTPSELGRGTVIGVGGRCLTAPLFAASFRDFGGSGAEVEMSPEKYSRRRASSSDLRCLSFLSRYCQTIV